METETMPHDQIVPGQKPQNQITTKTELALHKQQL